MKLMPFTAVLALVACAAPDPAYQAALANVPPEKRAFCETQGQIAAASAGRSNDVLGLMSTAYYNKTAGDCMALMVQQYGHPQHAAAPSANRHAEALAFLQPYFERHGREPVMRCGFTVAAGEGDEAHKMAKFLDCVERLPTL